MSKNEDKKDNTSEKNGEFDLPQNILEQFESDQQVQLIRAYRILQVLKYYPNNEPFFEKPENVLRGSKHYYDVIKSPMYLNEMKRKFFNAEYNSLFEVIKDMRLIFENCYYFWGPKSIVTDQCLQMERMMESQMLLLPKDLKSGCTLEDTHGKNEDDVVMKVWNRCRNKGKSCSRLMLRTWRKRRMSETKEYSSRSDLSKFCKNSKQIMKWERDVLFLSDILSFISSSLELPQIGLFFQLVQKEFDLTSICQTEVERIVIMPQYSSSFREILSALLSETHAKDTLSYEEITERIKNLVTEWYELLKEHDEDMLEVSNVTGIQKNFFDFVGTDNPMVDEKYENLPYCKKIIILKSVCDHLAHTQSRLKEIFQDADESKYSPQKIGKDKYGYTYLFFPTFLDFRLYKQKIKDEGNSSKDSSHDESEDPKDYRTAGLKRFLPSASTDFEIVADSTEGIRCHIDELFYADIEYSKKDSKNSNTDVIEALQKLEWEINPKESEYIRWMNETRVKLFNEWQENCESSEPVEEDETAYNNLQRDLQIESEAMEAASVSKTTNHSDGDRDSDGGGNEAEDEHEDDDNSNEEKDQCEINGVATKTLNHSAIDPFSEMESFIKSEPAEIEDNFLDYEVTPEIKEELNSDSHSEFPTGTSRRRSSASSYPAFAEDYYSDSNEFESPDDEFSSSSSSSSSSDTSDGSDEEWEIPSKRARTRKGSRASSSKNEQRTPSKRRGRPRRQCQQTTTPKPASAKSEDDSEPSSTTPANEAAPANDDREARAKGDSTTEGDEQPLAAAADSTSPKEGAAEAAPKPTPKLKVIDLARLKGADSPSSAVGSIAAPNGMLRPNQGPDASAFMIHTMPALNSLPMIRACVAQRMSNAVAQPQPMMMVHPTIAPAPRPNTFVMASFRRPATPLSVPLAARGPQQSAGLRHIAPAGVVPQRLMYRQTPMGRVALASGPTITGPRSMAGAPLMMMRKQPETSYNGGTSAYRHIAPMTKTMANAGGAAKQPMAQQRRLSVREIEGTIGIHSIEGRLQFVVNLANGSHVPLSNEQVQKLRDGNQGVLPQKLMIPVPADVAEKIEPCVVIDE